MTIADLFRLTPNETEILKQCYVREPSHYDYLQLKAECNEVFAVNKYYLQGQSRIVRRVRQIRR